LKYNTTLHSLSISKSLFLYIVNNEITMVGMGAICNALEVNEHLQCVLLCITSYLKLVGNKIKDEEHKSLVAKHPERIINPS